MAKKKPIWVQVAEAGFGETLEGSGWKNVSPAHWRRDGDRFIWRVVLDKPPSLRFSSIDTTDCFMDETGVEIIGLDDLIKKVDPNDQNRWFYGMISPGTRAHFPSSIAYLHSENETRRAREVDDDRWTWWDDIKAFLMLYSAPTYPELEDIDPRAEADYKLGNWWNARDFSVDLVSARLSYHWRRVIRPMVEKYSSAEALIADMYTVDDLDACAGDFSDIYANYVLGNISYCRRRMGAVVQEARKSVQDLYDALGRSEGFRRRPRAERTAEARWEWAESLLNTNTCRAEEARRVAQILDLDID